MNRNTDKDAKKIDADQSSLDFEKMQGLIPAIVQDARDGTVLMLGYMNQEALEKTLNTGRITFYSRSRHQLWTKGETSGASLQLVDWSTDCDRDSLLFLATPLGPTCHLGRKSCFAVSDRRNFGEEFGFLSQLEDIIAARRVDTQGSSYTQKLLQSGVKRIAQKIGEEGVEVALALMEEGTDEILEESADLIYHLLVGLQSRDLRLKRVAALLDKRHRERN